MNYSVAHLSLGGRRVRANRGATLLELLVVVAIIMTMTGLGLVNYRGVQAGNELRDAAQQVRTAFLETQALALGPQAGGSVGIGSYLIEFEPGGRPAYQIIEKAANEASVPGRFYTLPKHVSFQNFSANWPTPKKIAFGVEQPGRILTDPSPADQWSLELVSDQLPGVCQEITIVQLTARVSIDPC